MALTATVLGVARQSVTRRTCGRCADSVPFAVNISQNGRTVWAAMEGERIVCIAATAPERRRKYARIKREQVRKPISATRLSL